MPRRSGLGKGLSSLIPADLEGEGAIYREIDVDTVVASSFQPREHFDEESLTALAASIAELGVIQPIVVRESTEGAYELIAGERRWRAAKRAGIPSIPALIRSVDDLVSLETAVVENLHREDLNALEEASAYQQLIEDFGLTQDTVAQRVGRSRSAVANAIRLLHLPPSVQQLVIESQISAGHARALLATPDRALQEEIAAKIVAESLTVRQVEEMLRPDEGGGADSTDDDTKKSPSRSQSPVPEPAVLELEELLSARLETRVRVRLGRGPGRLVVDFADLDDLERIYRIITPQGTIV